MASQRGASANTGLIARQAAQQSGNLQQQAAGQGAALQAQQSLGAIQNMGNLATQQVGQQQAATGANTQAQLSEQQALLGNINAQNQAAIGNASQQNSANAQIQAGNQSMQGNILGGLTGALGTVGDFMLGGPLGAAVGGAAAKGLAASGSPGDPMMAAEGGQIPSKSYVHSYFCDGGTPMAHGGKVPVLLSPGEKVVSKKDLPKVAAGTNPMAVGKTVPGKPKVSGAKNSYANDTHATELEPGAVVVPRSVTKSSDPDKKAEAFVLAVMAKHGHKLPSKKK